MQLELYVGGRRSIAALEQMDTIQSFSFETRQFDLDSVIGVSQIKKFCTTVSVRPFRVRL
jgi:hypothetical protein